jgi:flagellar capping protein FliD
MAPVTMTDASATAPTDYAFATTTSGAQVGAKGNIAQVIQSTDDIQTLFNNLGAGAAIQYSGVDHSGNLVTSTYYKTAANTSINDFLAQVKTSFHGMAEASVGAGGTLTLTDKMQGTSQLALTSLTLGVGDVSHTVSTLTAGKEGAGVLTAGRDAFFSMDGLTLNSAKNNADGFISGVTIQLHKVSANTSVQTTITRDLDQVQKKIQTVLDSFNALSKFASDETKLKDPNDSTTTNGDLAGDMTVSSIVSQVRSKLTQSFGLFGGSYNTLTMIGVKSDPQTGDMSIDQTQFTKALTNNFDEVKRMFVTTGLSNNKNITLGRNEKTTQSGVYTLTEPDPAQQSLTIQLGSNPSDISDARLGDIITFSSGPATGLSITAPAGSIGALGSATFTFSKGLSDQLSELIDNFNDPETGSITSHQDSLQDQMKDADSRITQLQTRVNDYHDGLVKQFAAMEQALQSMKSQEAQMMSALGTTTTSTSS